MGRVDLSALRAAWIQARGDAQGAEFALERDWVDADEVQAKTRQARLRKREYAQALAELRQDRDAFVAWVRSHGQPGESLRQWRQRKNVEDGLWWDWSCPQHPDFVPSVQVRPEKPADVDTVDALVEAAFRQPDETRLVQALRDEPGTISLVAVTDRVVGHCMLSPVHAPMRACGLAPVAVHPDHQRRGAGAALVQAALKAAWMDHRACFVLGSPLYYGAWFQQAPPRWTCPWPVDAAAFQVAFANIHQAEHFRDGPVTYGLAFAAV